MQAQQVFKGIPVIHAERAIPRGHYCYTLGSLTPTPDGGFLGEACPFWQINKEMPEQMSGFCAYLKQGDWMEDGTFLLWDQVKECDVNLPANDEEF